MVKSLPTWTDPKPLTKNQRLGGVHTADQSPRPRTTCLHQLVHQWLRTTMDILGPEPGDKAQPWTNLHVVQGAACDYGTEDRRRTLSGPRVTPSAPAGSSLSHPSRLSTLVVGVRLLAGRRGRRGWCRVRSPSRCWLGRVRSHRASRRR